jgi:hypothetical protein
MAFPAIEFRRGYDLSDRMRSSCPEKGTLGLVATSKCCTYIRGFREAYLEPEEQDRGRSLSEARSSLSGTERGMWGTKPYRICSGLARTFDERMRDPSGHRHSCKFPQGVGCSPVSHIFYL